eukprot:CAMPEP_0182515236 /NCGR_PEP_ID=MMETSP1321-20130603/37656_1 /TAXON_ID=91990 /ORGANISM="Bolidomonas sp., Strain RCC1657" /LENGTH=94 /DNA_ID=CAMNT_0024722621 /DNA_START=90 /DNA_END=370 /DNA_ORIENTATION=+
MSLISGLGVVQKLSSGTFNTSLRGNATVLSNTARKTSLRGKAAVFASQAVGASNGLYPRLVLNELLTGDTIQAYFRCCSAVLTGATRGACGWFV